MSRKNKLYPVYSIDIYRNRWKGQCKCHKLVLYPTDENFLNISRFAKTYAEEILVYKTKQCHLYILETKSTSLFVEPKLNKYYKVEGDYLGPVSCNASDSCSGTNSTQWTTPNGTILGSVLYIQNITKDDFGEFTCAFENTAVTECTILKIMVSNGEDKSKYNMRN